MPTVELGDICEFLDHRRKPVSEELRTPGPFPYYGANGQQGWIDDYIFDETLVLLAEDGGHFGSKTNPIAYKVSGKTWVNNHAHVLRPLDGCDADYLAHVLSFYDVTKLISGTTRLKLTKGNAEMIRIPLPDLSEQRRIARRLEQADRLRRTRRYALDIADTFLPAAFLELLGSPRETFKRWPIVRLDECCQRITDGTHLTPEFLRQGVPFIFVKNIENARIDFTTDKFISTEVYEKLGARCPVEKDDILYTIVGATYGQAAPVGAFTKFSFQRHIAHLKPDPKQVVPKFLVTMMQLPVVKNQADRWARGAAQPTINLKELREFLIPLPPLPLQQKFAALVERVECLRAVQRESLRQAEHLFASLLHHAFSSKL